MTDIKLLKQRLAGKWGSIVLNIEPNMAPAIEKKGKHTPCLIHGGKDGFRVMPDFFETGGGICNTCGAFPDGISLIQGLKGWDFKEVIKYLHGYQAINNQSISYSRFLPNIEVKPNANKQKSIDDVLKNTKGFGGVCELYLEKRGLCFKYSQLPENLISIDSLLYWGEGETSYHCPAMIGVVRNVSGDVVSLHRTYLTKFGYKANVFTPKKLMSPALSGGCSGAAVHLYQPTDKLAITEGIETALAVRLSTNLPVWAALSSTMMEKVEIPISVKEVYVMADKDKSGAGVRSAFKLANRLMADHIVRVVIPDQEIPDNAKSVDWLDVYQLETGFSDISGGQL
tara:strand:- start:14123 stop:15145 length:1023 start_codon:yes stop_codon:yes gene_type:complete